MKIFVLSSIICLLFSITGFAQSFTDANAGLDSLSYSWATWGDYDNDGDLDIVLTGQPGNTVPQTKIFRNDSGVFHFAARLKGLSYSSADFGDYDNDGDLDLLLTGRDSLSVDQTKIYRNDNGVFVDILAVLPAVSDGQAKWGDYNNDGKLDILLAGSMKARILRNEGGGLFTDIGAHLTSVQSATVAWGDYNNDGQLDALIGGDTGAETITRLYKNNYGDFELDSIDFVGLSEGKARFADLNNDGLLDILINGNHGYVEGMFEIYRNMGDGQFTMIDNYNFNVANSCVDVADYDNDGLLDIVLVGKILGCGGTAATMLYHNEGFFVFIDQSTLIQGIKHGSVQWGDYNNDGYPDLLFSGMNPFDDPVTMLYKNNLGTLPFVHNTPPFSPEDLISTVNGNEVTLRWTRAKDDRTPTKGLSSNLYVGTSPDLTDIVSPMADVATGFRQIAAIGNACSDTIWTIKDLPIGNYFWSVQTIDGGFMGSPFAGTASFSILTTGVSQVNKVDFSYYPNPVKDKIMITPARPGTYHITVQDIIGKTLLEKEISGYEKTIDLSFLSPGIFLLSLYSDAGTVTKKIMKE